MIRKAEEKDNEQLIDGIIQIYHDMESPLFEEVPLTTLRYMIKESMKDEDYRYRYEHGLVCVRNDKTAGFVFSYDGTEEGSMDEGFRERLRDHGFEKLASAPLEPETKPNEWYIDNLLTVPAFRKQGVGTELLEAVSSVAVEAGKSIVGLNCDQDNDRAKRLYEKQGFKKVGEVKLGSHLYDHMTKQI
ncbi:MAG: GNAT family N-acetyltransferase [Pisciglobus halotolerans]|nr:GNAT family N-acetyltransferase [Pisciglobus halotolerans]